MSSLAAGLAACSLGAQTADPVEERYRDGVGKALERFDTMTAGVRYQGGRSSLGRLGEFGRIGADEPGVPVAEFQRVIEQASQDVAKATGDPALAGMRAYARVSLTGIKVDTIQTAEWGPCVRQSDAQRAFKFIQSVLDRMRAVDKLRLDLRVTTEPSGAQVRIAPAGGGFVTELASDGTITNFYRGYYTYSVVKVERKPAEGVLNLVDQRGSRLSCKLPPAAAAEEKVLCNLLEN